MAVKVLLKNHLFGIRYTFPISPSAETEAEREERIERELAGLTERVRNVLILFDKRLEKSIRFLKEFFKDAEEIYPEELYNAPLIGLEPYGKETEDELYWQAVYRILKELSPDLPVIAEYDVERGKVVKKKSFLLEWFFIYCFSLLFGEKLPLKALNAVRSISEMYAEKFAELFSREGAYGIPTQAAVLSALFYLSRKEEYVDALKKVIETYKKGGSLW
jgi:hypothetical protein